MKKITQEKLTGSFEEKKELVSQFNLMDDEFFAVVMKNRGACQYLIRKLMGNENLKIIENEIQYQFRNPLMHSCVMDCLAEDENHKFYNIEIQTATNDDDQIRRMRYYRSAFDFSHLEKGEKYRELPDIYSIMVCDFDIFQKEKIVYNCKKVVDGLNITVDDGVHEMYFNATTADKSELAEFLQYLKNSDPSNKNFGELSETVSYIKETEKGVTDMCQAVENYGYDREKIGEARGRAEGKAEGQAKIIKSLIETGMSVEEIAKAAKISVEEVKKLAE